MRYKKALLALLALLLTGCTRMPEEATQSDTGLEAAQQESTLAAAQPSDAVDAENAFSNRDYEAAFDPDACIRIDLKGGSAACSDAAVQISGSTATITGEGTYLISGTLDDGRIVVDAAKDEKIRLVLDGASIHSQTSAPIYVRQADKVFLTLAEGSENTLSNGGSFVAVDENNIDAVIFSKDDMTINGSGSLTVTSPAGHGIVSKDELTITGGSYSLQTAAHGLTGQDSVCIDGAALNIDAGKDGIQAEHDADAVLGFVYIAGGSFAITAQGDGISASSTVQIDGGSFAVTTGGGSANAQVKTSEDWGGMGGRPGGMGGPGGPGGPGGGMGGQGFTDTQEDSTSIKGIKAASALVINNGSFTMDCADDAVHSNGMLTVNGGSFTIATGDDGFHADETLTLNAGQITITQSYEGLEGQAILVSGGDITLVSSDDGLNAAGGNDQSGFGGHRGGDMFGGSSDSYIVISGGTLFADADGDGIDSNGDLTVSGGYVVVEGPTGGGNGPLDYGGNAAVSGGTVIITGSVQMAQSMRGDGQGVLGVSLGNQAAGTAIEIRDDQGNVLISAQPGKDYACIVASCPELVSGQTYTLVVGQLSGEVEAQ